MHIVADKNIGALYHGTTEKEWRSKRETEGILYLTASRMDAENYAEEAAMGEWSEEHNPVSVIALIGAKDLQILAQMPGVEICPDWGWVDANTPAGSDVKYTWEDSYNACGCIAISGFLDEHKKLFHTISLEGTEICLAEEEGAKQQTRSFTRAELEAMPIDELDRLAFGYANDDVAWVSPEQLTIVYPDDMANPEYQFERGGMPWVNSVDLSEPISVAIDNDGKLQLMDGHHRYFAAKIRGEKLIAQIEIKGNPVQVILQEQKARRRKAGQEADFGLG